MSHSLEADRSPYLPCTDDDAAKMLAEIGLASVESLFEVIPDVVRLGRPLNLPQALAEQDLVGLCRDLSTLNTDITRAACFLGAGVYDHYIPAVVEALASRSEFVTAYTPYQAEASQGILQSIYEYQSLLCALTGMDVANAGLYDGATSAAEAVFMACRLKGKTGVLVSRTLHPHYRRVLSSHIGASGLSVTELDYEDGVLTKECLSRNLDDADDSAACVLVQYPNFFGCIEPLPELVEAAHARGCLVIACADPIALGLLTSPGQLGVDIVVGEGQSLGMRPGFGGPLLGIFACRREYIRAMPGRIVGATVDRSGRKAFTLTLQTREQHIRREKATSNICTNQALSALTATIYLSSLGRAGLRRVAQLCLCKSHYLQESLVSAGGFTAPWRTSFFKEFVVRSSAPVGEMNRMLLDHGIIGGLDLGEFYPELEGHTLLCVTEKRTRKEIDRLVELTR